VRYSAGIVPTFDFERRSVVAGLHEAAEGNGNVGDFARAEEGGVLVGSVTEIEGCGVRAREMQHHHVM
jgi:hypothetical protein